MQSNVVRARVKRPAAAVGSPTVTVPTAVFSTAVYTCVSTPPGPVYVMVSPTRAPVRVIVPVAASLPPGSTTSAM